MLIVLTTIFTFILTSMTIVAATDNQVGSSTLNPLPATAQTQSQPAPLFGTLPENPSPLHSNPTSHGTNQMSTQQTQRRTHRKGPSAHSLMHPKEPREGDLERGPLPREVDAQNEDVEEIIRPNTGLNTRFGPGWKAELLAWQSELLSTMTFLIPAFGGLHEGNSNLENSLVFGLSLAVSVLQFGQSYMNPMIALCQGFVGEIAPVRVINVITAEIVGAIAASGLVWALTGEIRGHVALGPGTSVTQGLFIETVAAATLAYLVLLITHEKHNPIGALAPLTVGFALTSLELFTIPYTSGSLNFARAIGPSIVSGKFHGYEWIYFVSNILGAISATAYYRFVRAVQVSPKTEALYGPALALAVRP